jgi:hypothetical protein
METKINEIEVNGVKYIPKDSVQSNNFAEKVDGMDFCIVRGDRSGVFFGYIKSKSADGKQVELVNSRNIYYWDGAAGISQLAEVGTSAPNNCKFAMPVKRRLLTDVIQIDYITDKAAKSLNSVAIWKK